MPKLAHANDTLIRQAKPRLRDYRIGCGQQLFLRVTPTGFKYWQIRYYRADGREALHQFGSYPGITLAAARKQRDELLPQLKSGSLVIARAQEKQAAAATLTFDECAARYIESKSPEWKNAKHAQQWQNTIAKHASPKFGKLAVNQVTRKDIMACLEPIWLKRNETASRLRGRIELILDWASAQGLRSGDNPAKWKAGLQSLLSAPAKTQKTAHHAAMPWQQLPSFFQSLSKTQGVSASALRFLILTASRTAEVLGAKWQEIQGEVWIIPSSRMKAGREHRVPLSPTALQILESIDKRSEFIFCSERKAEPMSNMALAMQLRRLLEAEPAIPTPQQKSSKQPSPQKWNHATVHGFRSSFRDWCAEATDYPREVCEHALAHQLPDRVEAAYLRSDYLGKRRELMNDWAKFVVRNN